MNNAVMRATLTRIGFSEAAAQAIVEDQGIDSLDEIKLMTDIEIESLCNIVRRPGGTIPAIARVSRTVTAADITLETIRSVRDLREFESTYKAPTETPTINAKDWPKTMESIEEYLRSYLGERKIPLAYVIRKNDAVPEDDVGGAVYPTIQDEMIARAPHYTLNAANMRISDPTYLVNREKVWDIISKITREHSCWTYVKPAQRTRDGRMAFLSLYQHFLGPNNVDNMATLAEDKLKNTVYNGEQRRWDFERYVNVHKQQHSIMEGLIEHGYTGIDPRSKVRFLLDGIKTDKFDAVKTRIMSDERLRSDFDACVTLYQDYIRQTSKSKKELAAKRLKRGHKPGAKDSKVKGTGGSGTKQSNKDVIKNLKAVNRQVSQLAKQMGKTGVNDDDTDSSTNSGSASNNEKRRAHPIARILPDPSETNFDPGVQVTMRCNEHLSHARILGSFASQEHAITASVWNPGDRIGAAPSRRLCSASHTHAVAKAKAIVDGIDAATLSLKQISVTHDDALLAQSLSVLQKHGTGVGKQYTPEQLASNWGIDLTTARRTIDVTTQRGVRTVLHPTLSRRFRTNDRQLRYRRLAIDCFTDTLISNTVSRRNNKYAQIFATSDGWCRAYPMSKKSMAHEGLSLLFQREGVPNTIIMDGAREQTMGLFRKKCREVSVHVKQTEPHTPWSNAAEAAIRELKKGVGRQMVRSRAPKRLWDDCLEREAYVRSFTAHEIFRLSGQVPETIVSGETADISPLAQFKWYEWVMFRDTSVTYPDDALVLGRDLGPAIDIGPAMTRKILKANGQVVYRSTVRSLTPDEMADTTAKAARDKFTESVNAALGEAFKYEDFVNDPELEAFDTPI
ncbi:Reverse transcriptase (RNA-dependent DNA polymerase) [Fragilaria crotonensis]|nr:Reverse transcriptase (RNA-dependent DNA polymerase) [Fragilaria crotonensis]